MAHLLFSQCTGRRTDRHYSAQHTHICIGTAQRKRETCIQSHTVESKGRDKYTHACDRCATYARRHDKDNKQTQCDPLCVCQWGKNPPTTVPHARVCVSVCLPLNVTLFSLCGTALGAYSIVSRAEQRMCLHASIICVCLFGRLCVWV
jgi:hypothetical protein